MRFGMKQVYAPVLAILMVLGLSGLFASAQETQHVVSLDDLNKDAARPTQTRQSNEETIRSLLSSEAGQKALKSSGVDYQKVDKAIGQLSDEDASKLAQRARVAQRDFAAGTLSDRDLLWIILIIVAVLIIALAVR